jgi:rhodanese-related sulfurtransferase
MPKQRNRRVHTRGGFSAYMRRPMVQLTTVVIIALVVVLIALTGSGKNQSALPAEISVDQAYQMYQEGAFVLDVRTQEEWNQYHVPNTTLIPLDQLQSRLNELPKDKQIIVVCRSGGRSHEGRDVLLSAGFQATCMTGGLNEWSAKGYPIEGTRP